MMCHLFARRIVKRSADVLLVLFLGVLVLADAETALAQYVAGSRAHPRFDDRWKASQSIVILPPKISLFQVGAGSVPEPVEEWSAAAQANFTAATAEYLQDEVKLRVSLLKLDPNTPGASALDETWALYDAVEYSILLHTFAQQARNPHGGAFVSSVNVFSEKVEAFEYSLGSEVSTLAEQTDALMIIRGSGFRATTGRQALQMGTALLGLLGGLVIIPGASASNDLSVALVDARDGAILWYARSIEAADWGDPVAARQLVRQLFSALLK